MATTKGYVYVGSDRVVAGTGNYVYILLEASSQKAYLEGGTAGTPVDDSQIAYLKGEDTTLDSQSAYMFCGTVADSSVSAYLKGRALSSQKAYLSGPAVDWIDDCEDKNTWGSIGTLSNSTDRKQGSYSTQCSATPLASKFYKATFGTPFAITTPFTDPCIHLWLYLTDASALSDWGQIEITSSGIADNQEIHWNISNDKITTGPFGIDIQLEDGWNEIYLRIADGIPTGGTFNGSIRYFRLAYTTSMNQIIRIDDVYVTEYTYYKSSVSAFLTSDNILAEDTTPAFLEGKADTDSSKSAYMFCGTVATSSVSAYMIGDPVPVSDSKSAYLYGGTNVKDSQAAFMSMGTIAEGTASAFMDAESTTSAIKSCFLEGQHPRSYQNAFMTGQWAPTADDSTGAFLDSDGAWPFSDNFTGDDEDDWSEYKWLTGRNE